MKASDFRLGQRVRRRSGENSFVPDRRDRPQLKGRRTAIVIGLPEPLTQRHIAALIQYENSTYSERVLIHRLEALPIEQQPIALGGQWQYPEGGPFSSVSIKRPTAPVP